MAYSLAFSQAILILSYIAIKLKEHNYEFLSSKEISKKLNIAFPTAVKVIKSLTSAGIIITKEGVKGGIILSKSPSDLSLLEIFNALEQEKQMFKIHSNLNIEGEKVNFVKNKMIKNLQNAESSMKDYLSNINLNDLI